MYRTNLRRPFHFPAVSVSLRNHDEADGVDVSPEASLPYEELPFVSTSLHLHNETDDGGHCPLWTGADE